MAMNVAPIAINTNAFSARQIERATALCERVGENRQRTVLGHWIALARKGPIRRRDLSPEMFGRALQYVDLIEVMESGDDYRHIIEGREIIRRFGRSGEDPFSTLYETSYLGRLNAFYQTVQITGTPNLRRFVVQSMVGEEMTFTQLALPATDAKGRVSHLAVVFDFPDQIRSIPTASLLIHSGWRRLERGTERETIPGDRLWR